MVSKFQHVIRGQGETIAASLMGTSAVIAPMPGGERALGIGRDRLIAIGDQESRRQGDFQPLRQGGRGERLLGVQVRERRCRGPAPGAPRMDSPSSGQGRDVDQADGIRGIRAESGHYLSPWE